MLALLAALPVAAEAPRPFAWTVSSGRGRAVLLGSIHVARPDLYPLDSRLDEAFAEATTLVVEADPTGNAGVAAAARMLASGTYPPGDGLDRHVPASLHEAAAKRFASYGLPPEQWNRFKPWLAAMTITMAELARLGMLPQYGIDVHFLDRARQGNKKIVELEGAEAQIRLLDGLDETEQRLFLEYTLRDVEQLAGNTEQMLGAWRSGDAEAMERLLFEPLRSAESLRPIYRKLFEERNREMAKRIEALVADGGRYFVVVGAGHLVGEDGLLELLGKRHRIAPL